MLTHKLYAMAFVCVVMVIAMKEVVYAESRYEFFASSPLVNLTLNSSSFANIAANPYLINDENKQLSMDQAVAKVRQRIKGQVLSAEGQVIDGRLAYRIKILTSRGQVKVVLVDAETGNIVND